MRRSVALFLAFLILFSTLQPTIAWAVTSGPSQPEFASFTPFEQTSLVDNFTGDFKYNIPLMEIDGYPINLAYEGNVNQESEASWTGLGWSLNPGAINRSVRGIPDDFNGNGDNVTTTTEMKPRRTFTGKVKASPGIEVFGYPVGEHIWKKKKRPNGGGKIAAASIEAGFTYDNYNGLSFSAGVPLGYNTHIGKAAANIGLNLGFSSQGGYTLTPNFSCDVYEKETEDGVKRRTSGNISLGIPFNSESGFTGMQLGGSVTKARSDLGALKIDKSALIPFGSASYPPSLQNGKKSVSVSGTFTIGQEMLWASKGLALTGVMTVEEIRNKVNRADAYGFMYNENAKDDNAQVITDYNRESEAIVTKELPLLPTAYATFDYYSVSGQGIGGTYRIHRDQATAIYDQPVQHNSNGYDVGFEIHAANLFKGGADVAANFSTNKSGAWTKETGVSKIMNDIAPGMENSLPSYRSFYEQQADGSAGEKFCFKKAGELNETDQKFYNSFHGTNPTALSFDRDGHFQNKLTYRDKNGSVRTDAANISNYRNTRLARTQTFEQLTAAEAEVGGFDRSIPIQLFNQSNPDLTVNAGTSDTKRVSGKRLAHHISEIKVTREDGAKFYYGVPVYELVKEEYNFALRDNRPAVVGAPRLAGYVNEIKNEYSNGAFSKSDRYYQKTETSAYASSYLLSAMVSNDYVDVKDDGPSADDIGTYVRFNYKKSITNYKWRTPYDANKGNYVAGNYSIDTDDKCVVTYGEREQFYLKTIESKNYVAVFYTSGRSDGMGVANRDGGPSNACLLQRLDSIRLFSIADYRSSPTSAIPIKTVHFDYDYTLCPGIPNGSAGKLTLKRVSFTYRNSPKGKLNPYVFSYSNPTTAYKGGAQDMWGQRATYVNEPTSSIHTAPLTNSEFPYVNQNQTAAEEAENVSAWLLNDITLPTGGNIHVDYESDTYAFVQEKRAMQMFQLVGCSPDKDVLPSDPGILYDGNKPNNYLFFEIPQSGDQAAYVQRATASIKHLYFRCFVDLTGIGNWEFVSGYAEFSSAGASQIGQTWYGWVKVKDVKVEETNHDSPCSPISKLGWQNTRLYLNQLINPPLGTNIETDFKNAGHFFRNSIRKLEALARGFNASLRDFGYSKRMAPSRSFIRLNSPDMAKKGGGARVAKLTFTDNWNDMAGTGYKEGTYGYTYTYTTDHKLFGTISSGVAQWEPNQGGDENPFKEPLAYSNDRWLAPNDNLVREKPAGIGLYPDPGVGYSQVKVQEFKSNTRSKGVGYSIYTFYTAKDFPVLSELIGPDMGPENTFLDNLLSVLKVNITQKLYGSQGLSLEFSNMHGVAKSEEIYGEDGKVISKAEYFYKSEEAGRTDYNDPVYRLKNTCTVLRSDGSEDTAELGIDFDVACDFREYKSVDISGRLGVNMDFSLIGFLGLPFISAWPGLQANRSVLRTAVMVKTTTRYPILESVRKTDMSSEVTERSLVYDPYTGGVLITSLQNQFNDTYYKTNIPAYFAYPDMGPIYKRSGNQIGTVPISGGAILTSKLQEGDVILATEGKFWISKSGNALAALDKIGTKRMTNLSNVVILSPSAKNQLSSSIMTFSSKVYPLRDHRLIFQSLKVIDAEASTFGNESMSSCACAVDGSNLNPYTNGTLSTYLPKATYKYLVSRMYTAQIGEDVTPREDGVFGTMQPIWKPQGNQPWSFNPFGWVMTNTVQLRNSNNAPLESRDALGQSSSAHFTYNQKIPKSMAQNAQYRQTLYEHFEDTTAGPEQNCLDMNMPLPNNVSFDKAHTGKKSVKVNANSNVQVKFNLVCPK